MGDTDGEVTIVRKNGSKITYQFRNGKDFILSGSRGAPPPVLDQVAKYLGTSIKGFLSHPVDVLIAINWLMAMDGQFDHFGSGPKTYAQQLDRMLSLAWNGQTKDEIRAEIQLYLLWQQTELRGQAIVGMASRIAGGLVLSAPIYTLGGRIPPQVAMGPIFFLSLLGAALRTASKALDHIHENKVSSYIHAFVTGSESGLNVAKELGEQFSFIKEALVKHPDAIKLDDPELKLLNWIARFAMSPIAECRRLVDQIKDESSSSERDWRLPSIRDVIPSEVPLPNIPSEIEIPSLFPSWNIPWGVPQ